MIAIELYYQKFVVIDIPPKYIIRSSIVNQMGLCNHNSLK